MYSHKLLDYISYGFEGLRETVNIDIRVEKSI